MPTAPKEPTPEPTAEIASGQPISAGPPPKSPKMGHGLPGSEAEREALAKEEETHR